MLNCYATVVCRTHFLTFHLKICNCWFYSNAPVVLAKVTILIQASVADTAYPSGVIIGLSCIICRSSWTKKRHHGCTKTGYIRPVNLATTR